jgi:RNA polymerase sigma factor (sigma-70 family)
MLARYDSSHRPATSGNDWDWGNVRALCLRETRRLLGSSSAADDAAQDATLRAWRHRGRCRTPATPEPWIKTIARREALRTLAQYAELSIDDHEIADTRQEMGHLVDSLDVRRAVSGLDSQDRRLLIGHYWQDLPNSELAMQLGLAEVTIRVRLHRLRRRLRDIMVEV